MNPYKSILGAMIVAPLLLACGSGKTTVSTVAYYSVPSAENVNYYRVNIKGVGKVTKFNYSSGWHPSSALDQLFGKVSSDETVEALEIRKQLRQQYNEAILDVNRKWLKAARNPSTPVDSLIALNEARKRVLAYPLPGQSPFDGTVEMEYNPQRDLVMTHSDDKLAIILSANPDEVVGKISTFSESDKTTEVMNSLSRMYIQREKGTLAADKSVQKVNSEMAKKLFVPQLQNLQTMITTPTKPSSQNVIAELNTLILLLKNFEK